MIRRVSQKNKCCCLRLSILCTDPGGCLDKSPGFQLVESFDLTGNALAMALRAL